MVWTPRDELERVPSFTEQERRARPTPPTPPADLAAVEERLCDSCGEPLDPVQDLHRARHRSCKPPPIPAAAQAVLDRLRARQGAS